MSSEDQNLKEKEIKDLFQPPSIPENPYLKLIGIPREKPFDGSWIDRAGIYTFSPVEGLDVNPNYWYASKGFYLSDKTGLSSRELLMYLYNSGKHSIAGIKTEIGIYAPDYFGRDESPHVILVLPDDQNTTKEILEQLNINWGKDPHKQYLEDLEKSGRGFAQEQLEEGINAYFTKRGVVLGDIRKTLPIFEEHLTFWKNFEPVLKLREIESNPEDLQRIQRDIANSSNISNIVPTMLNHYGLEVQYLPINR